MLVFFIIFSHSLLFSFVSENSKLPQCVQDDTHTQEEETLCQKLRFSKPKSFLLKFERERGKETERERECVRERKKENCVRE